MYSASTALEGSGVAKGRLAIESLVETMLAYDLGATATILSTEPTQQGAVRTWRYDYADGQFTFGCDVFVLERSCILLKDAYRKVRS